MRFERFFIQTTKSSILYNVKQRKIIGHNVEVCDNMVGGDFLMFKVNPYRPDAGLMPTYIAGRDEDINNIEQMFTALKMNIPTQSIIFSGLRGVGKTVLINKLQDIAEEKEIFCRHIEVEERNDFISQIATCSQAFLRKVSTSFE